MPRVHLAIMLASALCLASACEGSKAPAGKAEPNKAEPSKAEPSKTKPEQVEPPASSEQTRTPAVVVEAEGSAPADERPAPPAWFDASKFEHKAVTNQVASQGKIAGGYASAMVLELEPGTTAEDCVAMAREVIGETVEDVAEASPGGEGRLMLQGEATGFSVSYHYTIVCGEAKGKPTMYLSYTAKQ